jgi:hypothetical protein
MHQKCSNYALTNLLFGLCRSVNIINPLITCPSPHLEAPPRPSTPQMLRGKERTPTLPSIIFTFKFAVESIKEFGGASLFMPTPLTMGSIQQFSYNARGTKLIGSSMHTITHNCR